MKRSIGPQQFSKWTVDAILKENFVSQGLFVSMLYLRDNYANTFCFGADFLSIFLGQF
jgi:hypothetical protein